MFQFHHAVRALVLLASAWTGGQALAGNLIYFNEQGGAGGSPKQLYNFDPVTGVSTLRCTVTGSDRFYAMDRQPFTGAVYAIEPLLSKLYKINVDTGVTTLVGTVPVNTMIAIAFDPTTGVLYGMSQAPAFGLWTIDPNTAAATLVGPVAQQRRALCCSATGQLYCFGFDGRLFSVDKNTGAPLQIGGVGGSITVVSDASFTADGKLYATDYDGSLHEVDVTTGVETPIGNSGLGQGLLGLVDDGCGWTSYCTPKINALGCAPIMSASGVPSATATSGFFVTCTQVRNQKNGLLFYGITGQSSAPYQGGTLCVAPQIRRTGSQNSGGSPVPFNDCTGIWTIDMNAFAQSAGPPTPLANLKIPGTLVYCQWWGRDPGFPAPNNTQLSDGLAYRICP